MSKVTFTTGAAPSTPSADQVSLYAKADKLLYAKDDAGVETLVSNTGSSDEKAKVSANDTTAGFLNGKLVQGTGISFTENNDGGNETLTIACTVTDTDTKAKVSSNDTTAGFLNGKLVAGSGVTLTENNNGGDETLTIAASASAFDPITTMRMYDDFITGNEDTDELGAFGWRVFNNGTGTLPARINGEAGRPGIIRLSSGTTGTTRSCISLGNSTAINSLIVGTGQIILEASIRITGTLASFSRSKFGFGDSPNTNGAPVNGIYFEFFPGGSETTFRIVSINASTATRVDTSQTVVSGTWYRLRITINSAGNSIQASINGSNVGSAITTNIPASAISPFFMHDGLAGGSQVAGDIDYFYLEQTGLSR